MNVAAQAQVRTVTTGVVDGPLDRLDAELAALQPLLHRAELAVADLGVPIAPLYLASARGSLRHVAACIAQHASCLDPGLDACEVVPGSGVRLEPVAGRRGIGTRRHRGAGRGDDAGGGDLAAWPRRPDLGADLVVSPEAAEFCGGPVGSTLLFCALAHHRWLHPATRTKWSTDASGARALVSALNGGASCAVPLWGPLATLLDVEVVAMLATLGWTRMATPAMPRRG